MIGLCHVLRETQEYLQGAHRKREIDPGNSQKDKNSKAQNCNRHEPGISLRTSDKLKEGAKREQIASISPKTTKSKHDNAKKKPIL